MSSYVSLSKLIRKEGASVYKLTLAAAARANELAAGAQPFVKSQAKKVTTLALEEMASGKVTYEEVRSKGKKSSS